MALPTNPTYSTWTEFKAYTPVASQKTIVENTWKTFALRAEKILDSLVNVPTDQKYDQDQALKFPVKNQYGDSWLPDDVKLAHIEITSDLVLKGDAVAETGTLSTSESWSGTGYSVTKEKKSGSDDLKIEVPALAKRLLRPWTSNAYRITY